ncbi:MAG: Phage virion morphogenesis family protein [bacterium ADurb.Bin478]|nr:MAG: Phage virion morphogenesis family protein [bacterium ADurb.Bin478]
MAGAAFSMQMDGIDRWQAMLRHLAQADLIQLSEGIGALVENQTKERIADSKAGPDGQKWDPWSGRYGRRRHRGQSLLQSSNRLLNSITFVVHPDSVEIGTNVIYGATHQYGDAKRNIPARPYLGLSAENENEIADLCGEFIEGLLQ